MYSCSKESSTQTEHYKIQEYFPEEGESVRTKVYNFMIANNRFGAMYKDSTVALLDTDPNEAVWLMEAASNVEKYGNLNEPSGDSKTFTFEIDNITEADGTVKASSSSIQTEYTNLMTTINADETVTEKGQLIDLSIISVDNNKTLVNVDVIYTKVNPSGEIVLQGPPVEGEEEPVVCGYNWSGADINVATFNWGTENFGYPNFFPNGIYESSPTTGITLGPITEGKDGQFPSMGWYFSQVADRTILANPPIVQGSTYGTFVNPFIAYNAPTDYVPYSNVIIFDENYEEISSITGCVNINTASPFPAWNTLADAGWYDLVDKLNEMILEVEATLPNSSYRDYSPVYCPMFSYAGYKGSQILGVQMLGYIYENSY